MGMYDCIKFEMDCPKCKAKLNSFQSKDGLCVLGELEFWEVDNFYDYCDSCGTWVEFNLKRGIRKKLPLSAYKRTVRK